LSHGRQESLRVKKPCHPKHIGSSFKTPASELTVSFQQFSVPESQRGGFPGDLR